MKVGLLAVMMIVMLATSSHMVWAQDDTAKKDDTAAKTADPKAKPAAPGRAVPPKPFEPKNSEDALEELQGGNKDVFIVIFYVTEAKMTDLKGKIDSDIVGAGHPWVRTASIDLTKVKEYQILFRVLDIDGEQKRSHSEPIVLVMSQGEGVLIRGPKIVDVF